MKRSTKSFFADGNAFSLVEVLMAVAVISVAVYGMILSLAAQQMGDAQMRDTRVLRQLHYQLVREVLKGQRDQDAANVLVTGNYAVPSWADVQLTNPALGQDIIYLHFFNAGGAAGQPNYCIGCQLYTQKAAGGPHIASSVIEILYPYSGNWQTVKP